MSLADPTALQTKSGSCPVQLAGGYHCVVHSRHFDLRGFLDRLYRGQELALKRTHQVSALARGARHGGSQLHTSLLWSPVIFCRSARARSCQAASSALLRRLRLCSLNRCECHRFPHPSSEPISTTSFTCPKRRWQKNWESALPHLRRCAGNRVSTAGHTGR